MFRLFAFQSARVSVVSVKQPTDTLFRTTQGTRPSAQPASTTPTTAQVLGSRPTRNAQQISGRNRSRVLPRIASASVIPRTAPSHSDRRPARIIVSSTIATARNWSRISRFSCTSCHTRYGFRVATQAATRPTRFETNRRPTSYTSSAVPTATAIWIRPTAHHDRPKIQ